MLSFKSLYLKFTFFVFLVSQVVFAESQNSMCYIAGEENSQILVTFDCESINMRITDIEPITGAEELLLNWLSTPNRESVSTKKRFYEGEPEASVDHFGIIERFDVPKESVTLIRKYLITKDITVISIKITLKDGKSYPSVICVKEKDNKFYFYNKFLKNNPITSKTLSIINRNGFEKNPHESKPEGYSLIKYSEFEREDINLTLCVQANNYSPIKKILHGDDLEKDAPLELKVYEKALDLYRQKNYEEFSKLWVVSEDSRIRQWLRNSSSLNGRVLAEKFSSDNIVGLIGMIRCSKFSVLYVMKGERIIGIEMLNKNSESKLSKTELYSEYGSSLFALLNEDSITKKLFPISQNSEGIQGQKSEGKNNKKKTLGGF